MKKLWLIIISCMLLTGCTVEALNTEDLRVQRDANQFSNEYKVIKISNDNPYRYETDKEIISILQKGTGIIYFGFPECPWCQEVVPVLTETAKELKIKTIYYFNPKEIRTNNTITYQKIVNLLSNYLQADSSGNKRLSVPDVYFVVGGKIIGHHLGTFDWQTNPKANPLNAEQKTELKNIYKELIKKTYNIE